MDAGNKFWWFAAVSILITGCILAAIGFFFWQELSPAEHEILVYILKSHFIYIFIAVILLMAGIGFGLDAIFHSYILPLNKLSEEVDLIHTVNPTRRIRREGGAMVNRLIDSINDAADRYQKLQEDVHGQIYSSRADLERERCILASIMAQLPEGVLICNPSGQILFYNARARNLLAQSSADGADMEFEGTLIGLGRPVYDLLDRSMIAHALEDLKDKLHRGETQAISHFMAVSGSDRRLRTEVIPILNQQRHFSGFILIFQDITDQMETDSRADDLQRSLTGGIRSALAGIRAASEVLMAYPEMERDRVLQFGGIIHEESLKIGHMLSRYSLSFPERPVSHWPREEVPVRSLLEKLRLRVRQFLDADLETALAEKDLVVSVDSYAFMMAAVRILGILAERNQSRAFACRVSRIDGFVAFDFTWPGAPVSMEELHLWGEQMLHIETKASHFTLRDVLHYHDGEIWPIRQPETPNRSGIRLVLPDDIQQTAAIRRDLAIVPDSRPEFYDFDLFHQPDQVPEVDNQQLVRLSYTVFDTETTGLDPGAGDEIISIGAVRIVNNRLLTEERFEQLVNPRRPLSWESIQIHGIVDEMLVHQPTIEQVLPRFHRFTQGTVLVAHNAAFDMRMLQTKEHFSGVRFSNPVLDTMLLSAVVHPAHDNHNLTAIARRLGINITGRHTAIGDAIAAGEIFLKLIPLLAKKGIRTLGAAREASQKTYYARLKY
ncbi:MAG: exonuclease domain-containing protein [Desulfobacterales bacterium]